MSSFPEGEPTSRLPATKPAESVLPVEPVMPVDSALPVEPLHLVELADPLIALPEATNSTADLPELEEPLFQQFSAPEPPRPPRIPHLADTLYLAGMAFLGFIGSGLLARSALYFHLWGVTTLEHAMTDVHYTIGSMAALYAITFGLALVIFPMLWQKSFFSGLHWNAHSAGRHLSALFGAAGLCFLLAMVDELVLPGPTNAPIDKLFDSSAAAWMLFAFGVTVAPFFEELAFRGFLLPALATAYDWSLEKMRRRATPPLDLLGNPQWSIGAMVFASIATSVPFALMHAEQTAWALGPFLLLVTVSLILSWARLSTRSLAASVLVHASYNFLLFSLMLLGTHGFKHMDKM